MRLVTGAGAGTALSGCLAAMLTKWMATPFIREVMCTSLLLRLGKSYNSLTECMANFVL